MTDLDNELIIDNSGDIADQAFSAESVETNVAIAAAISKLRDQFAIETKYCIQCGTRLSKERKKIVPSATSCLPCAQQSEVKKNKPWLQ